MLKLPDVQTRLAATNRMEVMLGYSRLEGCHSPPPQRSRFTRSGSASPSGLVATISTSCSCTAAVPWVEEAARPTVPYRPARGLVNCSSSSRSRARSSLRAPRQPCASPSATSSVAAATLLQSALSVEKTNTEMTKKYATWLPSCKDASQRPLLSSLLNTPDFTPWFSTVTLLVEIGLLPTARVPPSVARRQVAR